MIFVVELSFNSNQKSLRSNLKILWSIFKFGVGLHLKKIS